jgi:hypothetical protein
MIDEAINCVFRGTFVVEDGQERDGDIVDVETICIIRSRPGCLFGSQAGWCYSFFGPLDGRMVEQEFFQNGGCM